MRSDRTRQIVVTLSEVACILGTLVGMGVLGTEVNRTASGALAADATLIAPAGPAFSLWSVIYLGLFAYTVWQWLPSSDVSLARATGWWAAASMLLNAAWLLVVQQGWLQLSVVVILALAGVLGVLVATLAHRGTSSLAERLVLDGTFGLYLGWVSVATCANIAATLVDGGVPATGTGPEITTVVVLLVVLGLAGWYAARLGGRLAVGLAMAWGLGWIAYNRLAGEPHSTLVGATAAAVAVLVLAVFAARVRPARS